MFRRVTAFVTGLALLVTAMVVVKLPSASAVALPEVAALSAAPAPLSTDVHIFYYPWYGNPAGQGRYLHWDQGGHVPPQFLGADLYPTLGAYDSGDSATIHQQMAWIGRAGAGVIVYSWWGQGSQPDTLAARVLDSAGRHGIKVAWHLEPYGGRTDASTVADINYINSRYGSSPAFYRDAAHGNRGVGRHRRLLPGERAGLGTVRGPGVHRRPGIAGQHHTDPGPRQRRHL
ncbi:hypothetical protein [Dactylosporangium sp. NPDC048998]|uniref:hypothetical protein n=1 Tax=Dactylosporangium sp. NPDC048998 TaxID=3363976 RepID=UPI003713CA06